jgi:effector-binding domain-containing protein
MPNDGQPTEPTVTTAAEQTTAVIHGDVPMGELANFFDQSFRRIGEVLAEQGIAPAGAAFARYHGQPTDTAELEVGFATATPIEPRGDVVPGSLPGGQIVQFVHEGAYDQLGSSWGRLQEWIQQQGHTPSDSIWEVYVTEPSPEMNPDDLRTELNWLLVS